MGAEFVFLEFEESQDGAATGGYAAPSSPEFREKQLAKFRELAPEIDIVITTALIPGRAAPKLWTDDMVAAMKPGSVVVDLAAERGGNCDLTVPDQVIETANGVKIIGYTDFPSRMATQASTLYSTNIRHMLDDLTPGKDGAAGRQHGGRRDPRRHRDPRGRRHLPAAAAQGAGDRQGRSRRSRPRRPPRRRPRASSPRCARPATAPPRCSSVGAVLTLLVGAVAPVSFMQHFIVFALACFVGFYVIWNVAHALHTPLMAITNAISSIIILGALLQIGSGSAIVVLLAAISILMASVNIFGGFLVTRRMLAMFQKS